MPSALQKMRKEAGYRKAQDFADVLGMAASSYARYERDPEKIPLKHAWAIADELGCSIDVVVGREEADPRGEVQQFYDGLSEDGKELFDAFVEFVSFREATAVRKTKRAENHKYDDYARYYEKLFIQSSDEDPELGDIVIFGTDEQKREAFLAYITERAAANREIEIEKAVANREIELQFDHDVIAYDAEGKTFEKKPASPEVAERIRTELLEYADGVAKAYAKKDGDTVRAIMSAYDRKHGYTSHVGEALAKVIGNQIAHNATIDDVKDTMERVSRLLTGKEEDEAE